MPVQIRNPDLVTGLRGDFPLGWIPISQTELAAPAASVTFSSIPDTYRTLAVVISARSVNASEGRFLAWRANADAGANYDRHYWYVQGDAAAWVAVADRAANEGWAGIIEAANSRANNLGALVVLFPEYKFADREKWSLVPIMARYGDVSADTDMLTGGATSRWRSTAAITSLTFLDTGANLAADSRFELYGVL
jgi:hypothetical protein